MSPAKVIPIDFDRIPSEAEWTEWMRTEAPEMALHDYEHAHLCLARYIEKDDMKYLRWKLLIRLARPILEGRGVLDRSEARDE